MPSSSLSIRGITAAVVGSPGEVAVAGLRITAKEMGFRILRGSMIRGQFGNYRGAGEYSGNGYSNCGEPPLFVRGCPDNQK